MSRTSISNAQLQALVTNLTTRAPKTSFVVAGTTYSPSKVVALAKSVLTARNAASAAKGKWVDALRQKAPVEDEAIPIVTEIRGQLVSMLSNDTGALTDLAISARKKATALTPEQRLVAAAKSRATREARGTLSKKAKAKVKGNVTGITVTTVTSQMTPPITSLAPATTLPASTATSVASVPASPEAPLSTTASTAVAAGAPTVTGH